jgi:hypothetical protein
MNINENEKSSHDQEIDETDLPNEVPRKCEFNHTLAAKAVECKARVEERQDTEVTFATVDRQIDRCLSTRCIEMSSPKHNILAAESTRQCLILKV